MPAKRVSRGSKVRESDLHLEVITVALHGSNAAVDAAGTNLVAAIGALEDFQVACRAL